MAIGGVNPRGCSSPRSAGYDHDSATLTARCTTTSNHSEAGWRECRGTVLWDTISVPVPAGHHRLQVDNTWNWKTIELDIAAGDHLKFQTMSRAGRFSWFLVSMLGAGPIYVSIKREE